MKINLKISCFLITLIMLLIACKPDKEDYTDGWSGQWQTTDETIFPQTKFLHTGSIIKDKDNRNQVIMSGTLLGLNLSYQIPIRLSSDTRGSIDYTNNFNIKGSARFNTKDSIWLYLNISQDNKTVYDTIKLSKIKQSK